MRHGVLFFVAMSGVLATGAHAVEYLVDEPGRWKPWRFNGDRFAREVYGASGADLKAFERELLALDGMIRHASPVTEPKGFNAETWGGLAEYLAIAPRQPKGTELPLGGALGFGAFSILEYRRNGKNVREESGETQLMHFRVNNIQPHLLGGRQRPHDWKGVDTDAFLQPAEGGTVAGFPHHGDYLVIKKRPDPLWVPVTVEEALRLVIAAVEKQVSYLRETRAPAAAVTKLKEKVAGIELHVASLRPEDRIAPSCWTGKGEAWGQRFQIGEGPDCRPLVRPNWAFFDRHLSRSAPQVLLVTGIGRCLVQRTPSQSPGGCNVNLKLLHALDREALLNWLH
ncbi:MAG: hypothetical protein KJ634_14010 [Gammaproteobacteria bacterium]|nr:hypothetical protein [Gammaproteobacteria bacterium]MBU1416728.1 hypothetical protein [Gammaproteobacteria bacterium]